MVELVKHLWWQFLHDQDAAKNQIAALKTWVIAMILEMMPMLQPGVHYHWTQWVSAVVTASVAAGATGVDPTRIKNQVLTPGDSQKPQP